MPGAVKQPGRMAAKPRPVTFEDARERLLVTGGEASQQLAILSGMFRLSGQFTRTDDDRRTAWRILSARILRRSGGSRTRGPRSGLRARPAGDLRARAPHREARPGPRLRDRHDVRGAEGAPARPRHGHRARA